MASESNYSAIFRSLYRTYGVPSTYPLTSDRSETRFWPVSKGITYQLSGDIISGAYKTDHCFLTSVQKGTRPFSLFVTSDSKVRLIATPTPKPTAKPTRRPTAKPTVAPKIGNAITIASVSLGSDSIGNPALYVVFKNNSGATVDRIDFTVECYDVYGRLIKGYGYYDESNCFYDGRISQGRKSDSSQRWMFYGFDGIKSVRIAITDYHTLNGKSVHVPRSSWDYTKYTFR